MSTPDTPPRRSTPGIFKAALSIMVALYRWSGGAIGGRMGLAHVMLLTTTGRKSGQPHTIPISYFDAGNGATFIVASNGGSDRNPAWYFNLIANTHAEIQIGRTRTSATATIAAPEERVRLWQRLVAVAPMYQGYERKTGREIPIVVLHTI